MSVGPITLAICPISGPENDRSVAHVWLEALPVFPPTDGLFPSAHPAVPIWLPPSAVAPVTGTPVSGSPLPVWALARAAGAARATTAIATIAARCCLRMHVTVFGAPHAPGSLTITGAAL
jgi:hypothetical protein